MKLQSGINKKYNTPIIFVSGETRSFAEQLGKRGIGFSWWGPDKIWYMSKRQFENNKSQILNDLSNLGVDISDFSESTPKSTEQTSSPEPTNEDKDFIKTDKNTSKSVSSVDPIVSYMFSYGDFSFPQNDNIASKQSFIEVNGEKIPITIQIARFGDSISKRKTLPSYGIFVLDSSLNKQRKQNEEQKDSINPYLYMGQLGEKSYGKIMAESGSQNLGTYKWTRSGPQFNEDEYVSNIIKRYEDAIQKDNTKIHHIIKNEIIAKEQKSKRDPELSKLLETLGKKYRPSMQEWTSLGLPVMSIYVPYAEKEMPVLVSYSADYKTAQEDISLYTYVDNPIAPREETLIWGVKIATKNIETIDDFINTIKSIIDKNQDIIIEKYTKYLQSFPYKNLESVTQNQYKELREILDNMRSQNSRFFINKLIEKGYIREKIRGEGWVVTKKAIDDAYSRRNNIGIDSIYALFAYDISRKRRNVYEGFYTQKNFNLSDVINTIKQDFKEDINVKEFINNFDSLTNSMFKILFPHKTTREERYNQNNQGQNYGNNNPMSQQELNSMMNELTKLMSKSGINMTISPENLKSIYRQIALQVHPDKNPNDPEALKDMQSLNSLYEYLSNYFKKANSNWFNKIIYKQN